MKARITRKLHPHENFHIYSIEKYYANLTLDFHTNKRVCKEIAILPSKMLRNKVTRFVTQSLMEIPRTGPRWISFIRQEEERERRDNYVPEVSYIDLDTKEMLKALDFGHRLQLSLPGWPQDSGDLVNIYS